MPDNLGDHDIETIAVQTDSDTRERLDQIVAGGEWGATRGEAAGALFSRVVHDATSNCLFTSDKLAKALCRARCRGMEERGTCDCPGNAWEKFEGEAAVACAELSKQ